MFMGQTAMPWLQQSQIFEIPQLFPDKGKKFPWLRTEVTISWINPVHGSNHPSHILSTYKYVLPASYIQCAWTGNFSR